MQDEIPRCCHLSAPSSWKPIKENFLFSRPKLCVIKSRENYSRGTNTVFLDFLPLHGQFAACIPRREAKPTYRFHHGDDVDDLRVDVLPPPLFLYEFFHAFPRPLVRLNLTLYGIHDVCFPPANSINRFGRNFESFEKFGWIEKTKKNRETNLSKWRKKEGYI